MRLLRRVFHLRFVKWLFAKSGLSVVLVFLAGWARLGWVLGFPAYAAPILLHNLYLRGVFSLADWLLLHSGSVAGGLVEICLYWPVALVLIVIAIDLAWLAATAPKQFLLGSLFSSERIEAENQDHLSYLDRCASRSIGDPFE